ncbi:MAG: 3-phosphoshikimate 1-carboxyvinyltransferase [Bacteroidetes bacterium]|nr:3-phosphoshikimate 1-carboxyvinyltransferase [Bacteroidota bacterium]
MSVITVVPSLVSGTIKISPSKSYSQRAAAVALLKGGKTTLENYGKSNDETVALEIIKALGASIIIDGSKVVIQSEFNSNTTFANKIFVAESGLSLRLFTCIAALLNCEVEITGEGSLLNRPVGIFESILPQLSVEIKTNNGFVPIFVKGNLQLKNIEINGEVSSQFLSGFILAFSYLYWNNSLLESVAITVQNLKSKPYIDVTIDVLEKFGLPTPQNKNYLEFIFTKSKSKSIQDIFYSIEGDWSSAAFMLVAGAIAGKIKVSKLNFETKQADKAILKVLEKAGVNVDIVNDEIIVEKNLQELNAFEFDATDCPDLFPPLVALAGNCNGVSKIKGVNRLKHKESNRGEILQTEFGKLGVLILIDDDIMKIYGSLKIKGGIINSNNDHRITMACAIAAINATENVIIEGAEAVNKSYPNFFEDLKKIGVGIK